MHFDNNGIATPESQAFLDQRRFEITMNPKYDDITKGSMLRDMYNQYGVVFGTYQRINNTRNDSEDSHQQYSSSGNSGLSSATYVVVFFFCVFGLGFVDQWLQTKGIHIGYIKFVQHLFRGDYF